MAEQEKKVIHKYHHELKTVKEKREWWASRSGHQISLLAESLRRDLFDAYEILERLDKATLMNLLRED